MSENGQGPLTRTRTPIAFGLHATVCEFDASIEQRGTKAPDWATPGSQGLIPGPRDGQGSLVDTSRWLSISAYLVTSQYDYWITL